MIDKAFKGWIHITTSSPPSADGTAEFQIDFGASTKVHSLMIVNVTRDNHPKRMGVSHIRLGSDGTPYATSEVTNPTLIENIEDGGFFAFSSIQ